MTEPASPSETLSRAPNPRRKALLAVASVVLLGGAAWAAWEWLVASHYERTDNAYVQGPVIQITPQIGGTVAAVLADDTDFVQAGQPLVRLDPADARVALQHAEAALGQAVRQARVLYANNDALAAQVTAREADIQRAQSELTRVESEVARTAEDLARRQSLAGSGAVSTEEVQHAQAQANAARSARAAALAGLGAAQAGLSGAREQLRANQTLTDGVRVEAHPSVAAAAARLQEAWLAAQRTTVAAPVDGYVARRSVQLGQRVAAGAPLMALIPLHQVWVDANFKEVQLRRLRIGQPVTLKADLWGRNVRYTGTVVGLGAGTGAAFALLPAQNATGNWIKVVQRVPVRIRLDAAQLVQNPLRVGLSMEATVDVTQQDGKTLADASVAPASSETAVAPSLDAGAAAEVRRIIAAHLGAAGGATRP